MAMCRESFAHSGFEDKSVLDLDSSNTTSFGENIESNITRPDAAT